MDNLGAGLLQQADVTVVDLGHVHALGLRAQHAKLSQSGRGAPALLFSGFLNLESGFMQVYLDPGASGLGQPDGLDHGAIRDRVGSMGANGRHDIAIVFPGIDKGGALAQIFFRAGTPDSGEIQ